VATYFAAMIEGGKVECKRDMPCFRFMLPGCSFKLVSSWVYNCSAHPTCSPQKPGKTTKHSSSRASSTTATLPWYVLDQQTLLRALCQGLAVHSLAIRTVGRIMSLSMIHALQERQLAKENSPCPKMNSKSKN